MTKDQMAEASGSPGDAAMCPARLDGLRLLVGAANFPNRIQPWLLRTTLEAIDRGADVTMCAFGRLGSTHPEAIDRYALLDRTFYLRSAGSGGLGLVARYALAGKAPFRKAARRGIARSIRSRGYRSPKELANALCCAVAAGIEPLDLVHSHSMPMSLRLLPTIRQRQVPLVHTFHGLPPRGVEAPPPDLQRGLFEAADRLLVNTEFARRQLAGLGCPDEKISVLPQGLDPDEFEYRPAPHPRQGTLRMLTVGRLHPDKGHLFAIDAVRQLVSAGRSIRYEVIGVGPERQSLERTVRELGLEGEIQFLGEVDDAGLRDAFNRAHVFLLPSLRDREGVHEETQGVVLQEAQASGKLVIATKTGGIPECVDDGESAWLVPDRDSGAIAKCVTDLLSQPDRWPDWQAAGRKWVEEHYHITHIGDRLAGIYQEVLEGRRSPAFLPTQRSKSRAS